MAKMLALALFGLCASLVAATVPPTCDIGSLNGDPANVQNPDWVECNTSDASPVLGSVEANINQLDNLEVRCTDTTGGDGHVIAKGSGAETRLFYDGAPQNCCQFAFALYTIYQNCQVDGKVGGKYHFTFDPGFRIEVYTEP